MPEVAPELSGTVLCLGWTVCKPSLDTGFSPLLYLVVRVID